MFLWLPCFVDHHNWSLNYMGQRLSIHLTLLYLYWGGISLQTTSLLASNVGMIR